MSTEEPYSTTKPIPIPLKLLAHLVLNARTTQDNRASFIDVISEPHLRDYVLVSNDFATYLRGHDPLELLVHIEPPGEVNKDSYPRLYEISAWRSSYEKWKEFKTKADKYRQENLEYSELVESLTNRLTTALVTQQFLDEDGARVLAKFWLQKRNIIMCRTFNVEIAPLIELDEKRKMKPI